MFVQCICETLSSLLMLSDLCPYVQCKRKLSGLNVFISNPCVPGTLGEHNFTKGQRSKDNSSRCSTSIVTLRAHLTGTYRNWVRYTLHSKWTSRSYVCANKSWHLHDKSSSSNDSERELDNLKVFTCSEIYPKHFIDCNWTSNAETKSEHARWKRLKGKWFWSHSSRHSPRGLHSFTPLLDRNIL